MHGHAAAGLFVLVFLTLAWAPAGDVVPAPDRDQRDKISRLSGLFQPGPRDDQRAELAARLGSLTRYPPPDETTGRLADALTACVESGMGKRHDRGRLAEALYVIMNGGRLRREQLVQHLHAIKGSVVSAGCPAPQATRLWQAAWNAARDLRNPRRDWW